MSETAALTGMLIAQAQLEDMTFVSSDKIFGRYADLGVVWIST